MKTILVMGLPGSGKTTFSKQLVDSLNQANIKTTYLNNDAVRTEFEDWDFSLEGRNRQAARMKNLAVEANKQQAVAVCDFICPTKQAQSLFKNDVIVFVDTIKQGRYNDTNTIFERPLDFTYHITSWVQDTKQIIEKIRRKYESDND